MLERILAFSIRRRGFVLVATAVAALAAASQAPRLAIDAVPDITTVQVQVNTEAPGHSPLEVEQRITFPIETALAGLPRLEQTRSISRYGLSQVTVVFRDDTNVYFARQLVNERLQQARDALPEGITPEMGPIATGLGEIFMYTASAEPGARKADGTPFSPVDLRTIHDWIVRPQLRTVAGVVEVNATGGYQREIHVNPAPDRLVAYGLTLRDLTRALRDNNANVGAGYLERNGEQQLVRVPGQVSTPEEIRRIAIVTRESVPIRVGDVAEVGEGRELRSGAATENGREVVLGTVFMLIGENSRDVARRVDAKLAEIRRSLPKGVVVTAVYDRAHLVNATLATVTTNLVEGALLVVAVLFLLLGNLRAALVTAAVIPLSMLFTVTGMVASRTTGNLMSLGALDFGLIVDGAVIIVENCVRRLGEARRRYGRPLDVAEREQVVLDASQEVRRATLFGELIIMIVYLPILTLTGIEGKMYFPMAFTVLLALAAAMILSLTAVPAACATLLVDVRGGEDENRWMRLAERAYRPTLDLAFRRSVWVFSVALLLLGAAVVVAARMPREFVPSLDEGDVALHALRIPGTSLTQAVEMQHVVEEKLREVPEVERVFSKIGTGDVATDPMPPSLSDGFVILKPRGRWENPRRAKADVVETLEHAVSAIPGNAYEFTQPIEMRFNELIAGVRSDVAIKVFGDDLDRLVAAANEVAAATRTVPGAADVKVEPIAGLPFLTVAIDREAAARYGLDVADIQEAVEIAVAGKRVGEVYEGDRRFPLVVRLPEEVRGDPESLRRIPLPLPHDAETTASKRWQSITMRHPIAGERDLGALPLAAVARFDVAPGPNQVSREDGKRRVVVTANVRGTDLGSFVDELRTRIAKLELPPGYWIAYGGQFEHLLSAAARLRVVVPVALLLILLLLYGSFGRLGDALLVYSGIPLALTGGVLALAVRGIPLSISAAVGFIALSGVAVLNGLVLVSHMNRLVASGSAPDVAAREGARHRLRPVLMTALVASLGFLPMALATGTGAEVQRPLATVVIGGIVSSTLLTLVVLPALYALTHRAFATRNS